MPTLYVPAGEVAVPVMCVVPALRCTPPSVPGIGLNLAGEDEGEQPARQAARTSGTSR